MTYEEFEAIFKEIKTFYEPLIKQEDEEKRDKNEDVILSEMRLKHLRKLLLHFCRIKEFEHYY